MSEIIDLWDPTLESDLAEHELEAEGDDWEHGRPSRLGALVAQWGSLLEQLPEEERAGHVRALVHRISP